MNDEGAKTKAVLIKAIEKEWNSINQLLQGLTEKQWLSIKNTDGWTIKDHIAHLSVWTNYVIALLKDQPRHIALGISEEIYHNLEDIDEINEVIFQGYKNVPLSQIRSAFHAKHAELIQLIAPLSDEDVNKTYIEYATHLPEDMTFSYFHTIYDDIVNHFRDHKQWIEEMISSNKRE